jgi:uncharacterized protein DUF4230
MLRKCLFLCVASALTIAAVFAARILWPLLRAAHPDGAKVTHAHAGPTIEQVRGLAWLTVLKVEVEDVQVSELHGYTGGVKAALVVKGDLTLSTDLSQARYASLDSQRRTATLVLPPPRVSSPRVDHARTRLVWVWQYGLWRMVPGERAHAAAVNRAYAEAQEVVAAAGEAPWLDERARAQAEAVLRTFFDAMEWSVTVRWSDRPPVPRS